MLSVKIFLAGLMFVAANFPDLMNHAEFQYYLAEFEYRQFNPLVSSSSFASTGVLAGS